MQIAVRAEPSCAASELRRAALGRGDVRRRRTVTGSTTAFDRRRARACRRSRSRRVGRARGAYANGGDCFGADNQTRERTTSGERSSTWAEDSETIGERASIDGAATTAPWSSTRASSVQCSCPVSSLGAWTATRLSVSACAAPVVSPCSSAPCSAQTRCETSVKCRLEARCEPETSHTRSVQKRLASAAEPARESARVRLRLLTARHATTPRRGEQAARTAATTARVEARVHCPLCSTVRAPFAKRSTSRAVRSIASL